MDWPGEEAAQGARDVRGQGWQAGEGDGQHERSHDLAPTANNFNNGNSLGAHSHVPFQMVG